MWNLLMSTNISQTSFFGGFLGFLKYTYVNINSKNTLWDTYGLF